MVQSVEVLLDSDTERHVTAEWERLVRAGLPSQGRHTGASNRPHVTLAVARHVTAAGEGEIAAVARQAVPLPVRLSGLLVFGSGPFVLARAVVPSVALLRLQARTAQAMPVLTHPLNHQVAGGWTAHVTLARRLDARQLATAVTVLAPLAELSGEAVAIRRWDSERKMDWLVSS